MCDNLFICTKKKAPSDAQGLVEVIYQLNNIYLAEMRPSVNGL